jgi:hypothetical protein
VTLADTLDDGTVNVFVTFTANGLFTWQEDPASLALPVTTIEGLWTLAPDPTSGVPVLTLFVADGVFFQGLFTQASAAGFVLKRTDPPAPNGLPPLGTFQSLDGTFNFSAFKIH